MENKQEVYLLLGIVLGALFGVLGGIMTTLAAPYFNFVYEQNILLHLILFVSAVIAFFVILVVLIKLADALYIKEKQGSPVKSPSKSENKQSLAAKLTMGKSKWDSKLTRKQTMAFLDRLSTILLAISLALMLFDTQIFIQTPTNIVALCSAILMLFVFIVSVIFNLAIIKGMTK
ncbi:MAG: hypothetical protein PHD95_03100 [Candidatus ainarchaeum sp.]|nr:hypothetical protein [Candidatus ainarchaeum sp.]